MPENRPILQPRHRVILRGSVQLAHLLQMQPQEFAKVIEEIENSPLFLKLFNGDSKVIYRKKFNHAHLSNQFYELGENLPAPAAVSEGRIEELVSSRSELLKSIRRMGQEKFERYFLYNDGEFSAAESASACGLSPEEGEAVRSLLNKVYVECETPGPQGTAGDTALRYANVAQVLPDAASGFTIAFHSPRMAQGLYKIDYKKLDELKKRGGLTPEEKRFMRLLLSQIGLVNARKNSLYQLILKLTVWQAKFFQREERSRLQPLTQNRIAKEIRLSPSSVCRILQGRSIQTPSGREMPLEDFFLSRKRWLKQRFAEVLAKHAGLTDNQIRDIIKKEFDILLSRRSINQYRNELKSAEQKSGGRGTPP